MKENVGKKDQMLRSVAGPALMVAGYQLLGGNKGRLPGLLAIVAGSLIVESAITRVCPLNEALGMDTRKKRGFFRQFIE